MLEAYIDESGDGSGELFTLSAVVTSDINWRWFELAWTYHLEKTNSYLKRKKRKSISRYKAADCSSRLGEFKRWTNREQLEFAKGLLNIFKKHNVAIISYTANLSDIAKEFPAAKNKATEFAYAWLLQMIMLWIRDKLLEDQRFKEEKVSIIHDRTPRCDAILLDSFNAVAQDKKFKHNERFTTIAPMGWEDCVLLQPADLIAYENYKVIERKHAGERRRKFMTELLNLDSVGGRGVEFPREAVKEFNAKLKGRKRRAFFTLARIKEHEPNKKATGRNFKKASRHNAGRVSRPTQKGR